MSNSRLRFFKSLAAQAVTHLRNVQRAIRNACRCVLLASAGWFATHASAQVHAGPLFSEFDLTIWGGVRTEILSPLFFHERREDLLQWATPPLMSYTQDDGINSVEIDFLYPGVTYDRFGEEYRFQIGQLLSFSGGVRQGETNVHRFSLFPIFLQQRSSDPSADYIWVLPFYGRVLNRFFRDEVIHTAWPLYVYSRKRDVETYNYLFPIVHLRSGPGLRGWQVWPLLGHEHKVPTVFTNTWGDAVEVPGFTKKFALWPIYLDQWSGLSSTNVEHTQAVLPLYSFTRSPNRDATAVPFVLGYSYIHDRVKNYREVGLPWPLVVFRNGESSRTRRVWPLYSRATNQFLESTWYLWPVYKYNRVHAEPLDRDRTRILLYLYSDITERNTETGNARRRLDLWPLFTHTRDWEGNERLQILAPIEPILPNNKSIERNYSPLWSVWRAHKNGQTGERSQSLLWNLYRREWNSESSRTSALFGLVQRYSGGDRARWRLFYWPMREDSRPEELQRVEENATRQPTGD